MSVQDLISAIATGSAVETEQAFNQVMAEKIAARLEDMRVDVAQSMFKESVELTEEQQIDEALNEVLSKDASAGEWIKDFVDSDNPKFEGKSKDKRKQMALAAYYAKQKNESIEIGEMLDYLSENEEVLSELSKTTLGSYIKKAGQHRVRLAGAEKELDDKDSAIQRAKHGMDNDSYSAMSSAQDKVRKQRNAVSDKSTSRAQGINTAIKKLTK